MRLAPRVSIAVLAMALAWVGSAAAAQERRWVATWASAQQEPEPHNALPAGALGNATLRQLVRISIPGKRFRVRLSNAFGKAPLPIGGANLALAVDPASSRIQAGTDRPLTFSGRRGVVIPAGAEYYSDPVDMPLPALATLAVSVHFPAQPVIQTGHPGSRATSYVRSGNHVSALDLSAGTSVDHWYQLADVEVEPLDGAAAIAVLGDSITDGFGVKLNTNTRWTDFLAERLQGDQRTSGLSVLNLGLGGNRVLQDGLGPNATARFNRDVLGRSGVRYLIILEGVNDLGTLTRDRPATPAAHEQLVDRLTTAYAQMVAAARMRGIKVIGATILPYGGSAYYRPGAANERDRQAINAWIRTAGNVDAVIDFDALMRDPSQPSRLRPDHDSGDGLHPSIAGYRAMADGVPLALFDGD